MIEKIQASTGILFIIVFLIGAVLLIKQYIQTKKLIKEFREILKKHDGQNFFCYNDRKESNIFIEDEVLPYLDKNISIIYLDKNRHLHSKEDKSFVSSALFSIKNKDNFPHLLKIRDGKIIDKSINNTFFNVFNKAQEKEVLFKKIDDFFKD